MDMFMILVLIMTLLLLMTYSQVLIIHSHIFNEKEWYKMFGFIKKIVYCDNTIYCIEWKCSPLKCASMNNQKCEIRPAIRNIYSNGPLFDPYSVPVNKCSSRCMLL